MAGFRSAEVNNIVPPPVSTPISTPTVTPGYIGIPSTNTLLSNPEGDYKYIPPDPYIPPAEPTPPVIGDGLGGEYGYGMTEQYSDNTPKPVSIVTNTKIASGPNKNGQWENDNGPWQWFREDHGTPVQSDADGQSDGGYIDNERSVTNRGNQMNGLIIKKMTQKDKHGNMISFEFEVPPMNEVPKPEASFPGGPRGTDTVPTWLTPGENVVNAEASRLYQPLLDQMNNEGRAIQAQQGGPIPDYASSGKEVPQYHAMGSISDELNSNENMLKYLEQAEFNKKYLADNQVSHLAGGAEVDNKIPGPYDWITENVLDGLAITESGGRHTDSEGNLIENLESGAIGKYQWKPSSAAKPGYEVQPFDVTDEVAQRNASYQYLKGIQKYNPDFTQAQVLQSFNAGPGRMRNYVDNIGRPDAITNAGLTAETFEYPDKVFTAAGQPNWDGARAIPVVSKGITANTNQQPKKAQPDMLPQQDTSTPGVDAFEHNSTSVAMPGVDAFEHNSNTNMPQSGANWYTGLNPTVEFPVQQPQPLVRNQLPNIITQSQPHSTNIDYNYDDYSNDRVIPELDGVGDPYSNSSINVPELDGTIARPVYGNFPMDINVPELDNFVPQDYTLVPGSPDEEFGYKGQRESGSKSNYLNDGLEGEDLTGSSFAKVPGGSGQRDAAFGYQDPMVKYIDKDKGGASASGKDKDRARKYLEYTHKANNLKKKLALFDPIKNSVEYNSVQQQLLQMEKKASKFVESAAVVAEVDKQVNVQEKINGNNIQIKVLEKNKMNITDPVILVNIDKKIADLKVDNTNKEKDRTYVSKEDDISTDEDFGRVTKATYPELNIYSKDSLKNDPLYFNGVEANTTEINVDNKTKNNQKYSEVITKIIEDKVIAADKSASLHTEKKASDALKESGETGKVKVKKAESMFESLFGDLFDTKELARMAVMYTGSRLLGSSHSGALGFSAVNYIKRIDSKAAGKKRTVDTLLAKGKHTSASIAAYSKSGDMNDLILIGEPINTTGESKYWYNPLTKKRVLAYKFKQGKNTYWSANDGKSPLPTNYTDDGKEVPNSTEYNKYVNTLRPQVKSVIDEIFKRSDKVSTGSTEKGTLKNTYQTSINPASESDVVSRWAIRNGIDVTSLSPLVAQAYAMALAQSNEDKKPSTLLPYLNALKLRVDTGVEKLFETGTASAPIPMDADKIELLSKKWLSKNNLAGAKISGTHTANGKLANNRDIVNNFWNNAAELWRTKTQETRDKYDEQAVKGETGFYVYAREQMNLPMKPT